MFDSSSKVQPPLGLCCGIELTYLESADVRFGFISFKVGGTYGATLSEWNEVTNSVDLRVVIDAKVLWPVLVQGYSESEKVACRFTIASTSLHELNVRFRDLLYAITSLANNNRSHSILF